MARPLLQRTNPESTSFPADASVFFWPRAAAPLAAALETALDQLPQLATAAQSHANEFHVDRTIQHLSELYQTLLERTD